MKIRAIENLILGHFSNIDPPMTSIPKPQRGSSGGGGGLSFVPEAIPEQSLNYPAFSFRQRGDFVGLFRDDPQLNLGRDRSTVLIAQLY
jgi:hypothetical protein